MTITYSFNALGKCLRAKCDVEARCIFFDGRITISELTLFDELEIALKESETLPDCVVVFGNPEVVSTLYAHWIGSTDARERFLARGSRQGIQFVKAYYFVNWNATGYTIYNVTSGGAEIEAQWEIPMLDFIRQGVYRLVQDNPVVQLAPSGHVFKHPSGTINKVFIQARELATNEPQVAFVGRALCQALTSDLFGSATEVFVDTMSIYPFVREALNFCGNQARVKSFHSYHALTEMVAPNTPYVVVISASTTGGMARRLHLEQNFEEQRLLTLIDMSTGGRSGAVLAALDKIDERYLEPVKDGGETEIELVGEHFSSKAKPPRAVTLGIPHRPSMLEQLLREFGLSAVRPINDASTSTRRSATIALDETAVPRSRKFVDWLNQEIGWRIPGSVNVVVHTNDAGSAQIAQMAAELISINKQTKATIVNYSELLSRKLSDAHGVLVVTAVAGDGGVLREISRDLRELTATELPRHFLTGVGLPQSVETWDQLRQFLIRNRTPREYGFSSWLVLPVGSDSSRNAWTDMMQLAATAELGSRRTGLVDKNIEASALDELVRCIKASTQGMLPRSDGQPLGISEGFLFFGSAFDGRLEEVTASPTYLAVASVLQTARDLKVAASRLHSTGYESVVLAPENFLRFNDNLLQACILRAAYPTEMDYSTSPHISTLMKELLLKIFERYNHAYGAAALEFAAALSTGRMRLKKADTEELVAKTVDRLKNETSSALLGFMLMIK